MGKASKWFKAFLGFKKTDSSSSSSSSLHKNPSLNPSLTTKKKCSNFKSYRDNDFQQPHYDQYGVSTSVCGRNDVVRAETDSRFKFGKFNLLYVSLWVQNLIFFCNILVIISVFSFNYYTWYYFVINSFRKEYIYIQGRI